LRDAAGLAPRLVFAGAAGLLVLAGADDLAAGLSLLAGWSPMTDVRGQTLNTGHLTQPTANAMGQIFMGTFFS
jgi:hypothetical protein